MSKTNDRRVKITKMLLQEALVELLQEKHISKISVTNLCETADVHRSTFYTHYTDQYDLLTQIQQEVLKNIQHYLEQHSVDSHHPVNKQKLIPILEYGKKNAALISVLLSENSDGMLETQIMQFVNFISLAHLDRFDESMKEYVVLFGISGSIAILKKWLENGMKESTESLAELIIELTENGAYYHKK